MWGAKELGAAVLPSEVVLDILRVWYGHEIEQSKGEGVPGNLGWPEPVCPICIRSLLPPGDPVHTPTSGWKKTDPKETKRKGENLPLTL